MMVLMWSVGIALAFILGWKIPRGKKVPATPKKQKTSRHFERQTAREVQNFITYDGSVQE